LLGVGNMLFSIHVEMNETIRSARKR